MTGTKLGRVVILVEDYDAAFDFYEKNFFCKKLFDSTIAGGQRYLHIAFSDDDSTGIWFLQPQDHKQRAAIGNQTSEQPTVVIYTDDCEKLFNHVKRNGIKILEEIALAGDSRSFHCLDLYGNRLVVAELITAES